MEEAVMVENCSEMHQHLHQRNVAVDSDSVAPSNPMQHNNKKTILKR